MVTEDILYADSGAKSIDVTKEILKLKRIKLHTESLRKRTSKSQKARKLVDFDILSLYVTS
jgi:hypothetical protein